LKFDIEKSELKSESFLCPILKIQELHVPFIFIFEHVSAYMLIPVFLPIRMCHDDERRPR
jgi:hypothetical protein